ncbi:CdaR family transcriptional regulator [Fusobacterium sp. PH5-44]|uniref:CdaR family transcriptional regulator n=1 Tax=unclassified Fusobacterium TaxID=2648384 RepID=UPI003D1CE9B4
MDISMELALNILNKMKEIIKQDLNFINKNGIIVASTDPERIGNYHEAALKCIQTKSPLIINNNDEFKGSKKGINMPIYFKNTIIGVIGITGDKNEVEKFGKIIKMMTEILVKEAWLKDLDIRTKELNRAFIERIVLGYDYDLFPTSNILFPYSVVVGKLANNTPFIVNEKIYDILKNVLSFDQNSIFTISRNEIIILYHFEKKEDVYKNIGILKDKLFRKLKLNFSFGIGSVAEEYSTLKASYNSAKEILNFILKFSSKRQIIQYDDIGIEFLFLNLDKNDISNFKNKILVNFTPEEIKEFSKILLVYEENDGSISKVSEELFMHKNTLQYKLNKIKQLSGYDPRLLKDFVILSLAFRLSTEI